MNSKGGFHYAYLIALTCMVLAFFSVGIVYNSAGIFYTPVSTDLGVGRGTFSLYMTVQGISLALVLPFAGKIISTKDARLVLTVCAAVAALIYIFVYPNATSVYWFYAGGLVMGVSMSFILLLMTPTLINFWFKEKVGLFMGVCLAFTGFGGVVFNPIGAALITQFGWRGAYMILGIIIAVACLPFTLLVVRRTPAEKGLLRFGETAESAAAAKSAGGAPAMPGMSAGAATKTAPFFMIMLFAICLQLAPPQFMFFPSFATSIGYAAAVGASMASLTMLGNMIGKFIIGYLNDKSVILAFAFGGTSGIIGLFLIATFNSVATLMFIGAFLFGMMYATAVTVPPMVVRQVFGPKDMAQIYARVSMIGLLCGAAAMSMWGFIADATKSFYAGFYICMALLVVAFVFVLFAVKMGKSFDRSTW